MEILYPNTNTAMAYKVLFKLLNNEFKKTPKAFDALDILSKEILRLDQILRETKNFLGCLEKDA